MSAFANEDDDSEFEVPDEEKLAIATHFLLSSPIGEFDDILAVVFYTDSGHNVKHDGHSYAESRDNVIVEF